MEPKTLIINLRSGKNKDKVVVACDGVFALGRSTAEALGMLLLTHRTKFINFCPEHVEYDIEDRLKHNEFLKSIEFLPVLPITENAEKGNNGAKLKVIVVEKRGEVYHAFVQGSPEISGFGGIPQVAIGNLVSSRKRLFGISEIKYLYNTSGRKGDRHAR